MRKIFKIAFRNLLRYRRRTVLTSSLITFGVVAVLLFVAVSGSFKNLMIGQITDSMIGHLQIHKKGYVSSIDNLPLDLSINKEGIKKIETVLKQVPEVEAFSPRIKFGGIYSNFTETTNIRLNAVYPDNEFKTVPQLLSRLSDNSKKTLDPGEIYIPELLANSMNVKPGDMAVIIATNKDGSVNGKQFIVAGILGSVTGPGGRDGYIHYDDGVDVLRMEQAETHEIAVRLKNFEELLNIDAVLRNKLGLPSTGDKAAKGDKDSKGSKESLEVHTWEALSPFVNIANMIDIMSIFIKVMLIAIVMISIMNVMMMAVYERIREIGTIGAIGTLPGKILSMFMVEGLCLGVAGSIFGSIIGLIVIFIVNTLEIQFNFGREVFIINASISAGDLIGISVIVIIISLIASFQPAFKASRMEPIKALRHV
ncbi:MAG: ABC transporter permease [Spirochaetes bacterium]|nr:ABC transporter permease [Spirochaetota bacterium]